jgi:hypothetical protein
MFNHLLRVIPRFVRLFPVWAVISPALITTSSLIHAADLKEETIDSWNKYIKNVDASNREHLSSEGSFLASDAIPGRMEQLRSGDIVVTPAGPHIPLRIASGLIHDWTGAAFIPNATIADLLPLLRDYDRYPDFYKPYVIDAKTISAADSKDQFSMIIRNKSVVAKTALDSDYQTVYTRLDDHRWYSISDSTRIQEIADYERPTQHVLPENHGTGLIWRLHSITRFEERDGGVYVEIEAIALSRDVPAPLHLMIDPIVRRVSRSSLATSLKQTEEAVALSREKPAALNRGNGLHVSQRLSRMAGGAITSGRSFR